VYIFNIFKINIDIFYVYVDFGIII